MGHVTNAACDYFQTELAARKALIDKDIAVFSVHVLDETQQFYGTYSNQALEAYMAVLSRGGKRIRGALAMNGYEIANGTNQAVSLRAARIIEMVHAYLLVIDDIDDRSLIRRNGPAAHSALKDYHLKNHFNGDAHHFGESIATNAALVGYNIALNELAHVPEVDSEKLVRALDLLSSSLITTGHGQIHDMLHEASGEATEASLNNVLEWKTAHYTIRNPLQFGMMLGGANQALLDAVNDYALQVGKAFQIRDDALGVFGNEQEIGKSPMDDIREGKRTLVTVYALQQVSSADKAYLLSQLGNEGLDKAAFSRCKDIIKSSGALDYARQKILDYSGAARTSLAKHKTLFPKENYLFLEGLIDFVAS